LFQSGFSDVGNISHMMDRGHGEFLLGTSWDFIVSFRFARKTNILPTSTIPASICTKDANAQLVKRQSKLLDSSCHTITDPEFGISSGSNSSSKQQPQVPRPPTAFS